MKLAKSTLRKRTLDRVKERARLQAYSDFQEEFNAWRTAVYPDIQKGNLTSFWKPLHFVYQSEIDRCFYEAQIGLSEIFDGSNSIFGKNNK